MRGGWSTAPPAAARTEGRAHPVDPAAPPLGLGGGEQWVLDQVRRHGVTTFVAGMTLVAIAASLLVVVGSLAVVGGRSNQPDWTRALVFGVVTPVIVGPPILLLCARLVARLDTAIHLLQESVVTDPLTGVANRRGFFDALDTIGSTDVAASTGGGVEVAMVDVDDFKSINDARGHPAGDTALCMVAAWLQQLVGDRGTVGRLGGDEFAYVAVIDPASPPPPRMEFRLDGLEFSVSIGRAEARDGDLHAALVDADADLYRQKQSREPLPPHPIVRTDQRDGPEE